MYQQLQEERVEVLQELMQKYLKIQSEFMTLQNKRLESCDIIVSKISKEDEINAIIEKLKSYEINEEIPFARAETKYQKILDKFNSHISKGLNASKFDLTKVTNLLSKGLDNELSEEDFKTQKELRIILSNCWEGKGNSSEADNSFNEIIVTPKGKKIFADVFNEYRSNGIFTMNRNGFEMLSMLLTRILNQIEKDHDVEAAMSVMILAQTFYLDKQDIAKIDGEYKGEKIFLQNSIRDHKIWSNKETWEKAIEISINQEINGESVEEETEEEKEMRIKNIIFGKLGAFTTNMLYFNKNGKDVEDVIINYAKKSQLSNPYIMALQVGFFNYHSKTSQL